MCQRQFIRELPTFSYGTEADKRERNKELSWVERRTMEGRSLTSLEMKKKVIPPEKPADDNRTGGGKTNGAVREGVKKRRLENLLLNSSLVPR